MSPIIIKENQTAIVHQYKEYSAGIYTAFVQTNGNSLLSSLLCTQLDSGASVGCEYFQTTSGDEAQERTPLISHAIVNAVSTAAKQILVSGVHNKIYCELTVSNGNATLGVVGTVVSTFATTGQTYGVKFTANYDTITAEFPADNIEIYRSRIGGLLGQIVESITVVYSDSSKEYLTSVSKI